MTDLNAPRATAPNKRARSWCDSFAADDQFGRWFSSLTACRTVILIFYLDNTLGSC
jgi:hypothetical protein